MKCPRCRRKLQEKDDAKTRVAIRQQLAKEKRYIANERYELKRNADTISPEQMRKRQHYFSLRAVMVSLAAHSVHQRAVRGLRCPPDWLDLLDAGKRKELKEAHDGIIWHKQESPVHEARKQAALPKPKGNKEFHDFDAEEEAEAALMPKQNKIATTAAEATWDDDDDF